MKVALLTRNGFAIQEVDRPRPGPGQVLVRSLAQGVCGGDPYDYAERAALGDGSQLLGHEGTGEVAALGEGVEGLQVGDVVTTLAGGFGEYYLSPAEQALRLPAEVDPVWALGEPLACCIHASWRFGVEPGQRVALIGCGFMGLVCLWLARQQGADYALAIEPDESRHTVALRYGASRVISSNDAAALAALDSSFDVVLEAVGIQPALDLGGNLVKQHGRLALIGYHQSNGGQRQVDMKLWNYKAIDVVNAHVRRNDEKMHAMARGIELLRTGALDLRPLATPYPLSAIETAFADLRAHRPGLFKAVLTPG